MATSEDGDTTTSSPGLKPVDEPFREGTFLERVSARIHPVVDDIDIFCITREPIGVALLVTSLSDTPKQKWRLMLNREYFVCASWSPDETRNRRGKRFVWESKSWDGLDRIKQAAETFQQYMLDTMDPPTKSAKKQ